MSVVIVLASHFAKVFDGCVLMKSHLCDREKGNTLTILRCALDECDHPKDFIEIFRLLIAAGADVNAVST